MNYFTCDCSMYKIKQFSKVQVGFGTSECSCNFKDFHPFTNLVGLSQVSWQIPFCWTITVCITYMNYTDTCKILGFAILSNLQIITD